MDSRPTIIPLFPLEKVLFPGMAMPLHIFEERYKLLIHECVAEGKQFGILHGLDVRKPVVGTTARIEKVLKRHDDGCMDIIVVGEQRFEVKSVLQTKAYLQAVVSYFTDMPRQKQLKDGLKDLISLYRSYVQRLGLEKENHVQLDGLMDELHDERELSYIIGQTIGMDLRGQQDLLEKTDPVARVKLLTGVLRRHDVVHTLAQDLFEGQGKFDPMLN